MDGLKTTQSIFYSIPVRNGWWSINRRRGRRRRKWISENNYNLFGSSNYSNINAVEENKNDSILLFYSSAKTKQTANRLDSVVSRFLLQYKNVFRLPLKHTPNKKVTLQHVFHTKIYTISTMIKNEDPNNKKKVGGGNSKRGCGAGGRERENGVDRIRCVCLPVTTVCTNVAAILG